MLRCACVGRGRHVAREHGNTLARDGLATLEWIERYLERVRELPVLAQVEPGEIRARLPAHPPERGRAVREPAARPRRRASARADALAEPAVLRVLRDVRLGACDPRGASRRRAEQRRDPLADVAGAPGARGGDARVARRAARPPRRLARPDRGRRLDLDHRRAGGGAPRTARRRRRRLLGACALVRGQGVQAPGARGAEDAGGRGVPAPARRARPRRRVRGRRHGGHDLVDFGRSRRSDRGRLRAERRLAARRRGVRRRRDGLPRAPLGVRGDGACRLARREPAQVAAHHAGLLRLLDTAPGRAARRVQRHPRVPPHTGRCRQLQRVRACPRALVPGAPALGGAPLLRPGRAAGGDPQRRRAWRRRSRAGCARSRAGSCAPRGRSRSSASGTRARTTTTPRSLERVNARGEVFLSHTKLEGRYVLRLAVGNLRTTEDDVRRAWDVLREEAA